MSSESEFNLHNTISLAQTMLNAMPICLSCWNKNLEIIYCNNEVVALFNLKNKQEYLDLFYELSPEYQPNGQLSSELAREKILLAFEEGSCRFEWLHQTLDSEHIIPSEVTLVQTSFNGKQVIAGYIRDLRELKATAQKIREADERTQIMLDATPLCANFWNQDLKNIDCNEEAVKLFDLKNKQEYLDNFHELSPEYQPNGRLSLELVREKILLAFETGSCRFEWLHQKLSGEPIPTEITLVRVKHREKFIVLGYTRDLRELKAMLREMHKVEADLRLARDAAEDSAKAKSEFMANMSHEIRTPMNGVLGMLYLVMKTELQPKQMSYLQNILKSANILLRIINDILDFSKIEAGKLEIGKVSFDLQNICSEVESFFAVKIKEKGLSFQMTVNTLQGKMLVGDPLRIQQVLFNLMGNALKFTETGGITIRIDCKLQADKKAYCLFSVKDTGIGLIPKQLENLFAAFSQVDASATRRYGGTGLGLAISKNLVNMMEGELWAESEYEKGSTFYFTVIFDTISKEESEIDYENFQDEYSYIQYQPQYACYESILLVEDNKINQLIALELLQEVGYCVDVANDGQEAIKMVNSKAYDLVLMDIQMPVMDGLTATKQIRATGKHDNLPIIAMSAHAMVGDKEKSLACGMNDHITKPVSPKTLYTTIRTWLEKLPKK